MNLYGDWGNVAVLERELAANGCEALVDKRSVGDDFDLDLYDFIYIGSGTERSQIACMSDLQRYKNALIDKVDAGTPVLATGNSHELFGRAVVDCTGNRYDMLGLMDFETMRLNTRVTGDCLCRASFIDDLLIGFINRAGGNQTGDVERPFHLEPGEGAGYKECDEGIRYKSLLGTYLTGPILVRNPPLLRYFADALMDSTDVSAGHEVKGDVFFEYQEKAYVSALSRL
jgi:CobQ-like glutamine amidotransferase family enzyme